MTTILLILIVQADEANRAKAKFLRAEGTEERIEAIRELARLNRVETAEVLSKSAAALEKSDPDAFAALLQAGSSFRDARAIRHLLYQMTVSESVVFRETVARAARHWTLDAKGEELLLETVRRDGPAPVRAAAIDSAAAHRLDEKALLAAASDSHRIVKLAAARALARLDVADAVPAIIDALEGEGPLKHELNEALVLLTGVDKKGDHGAWKAWWEEGGKEAERPPREEREAALERVWDPPGTRAEFYGVPVVSRRVLFLIDVSASMGERGKLASAREELRRALAALPADAKFGVIAFDVDAERWSEQMSPATKENREAVLSWLEEMEPEEGTNILNGLTDAFRMAGVNQKRLVADTVYLVTDGRQSLGKPDYLLRRIGERNPYGKVIIHTVSIGKDADREFLRRLAAENGGTYAEK